MRKLSRLVLKLLENKGITGIEEIEEFISPSPKMTYDPFLMLNMEEGVELVIETARAGRRICVYGDYDADGITSTVMMTQILRELTDNLFYYIPSRFDEGYGLNMAAVDTVRQMGADLIVTVDCGSVSVDEIKYAKSLGMEVLVTDHHTVGDEVADCLVINPRQANCMYPFSDLAGCGVVFKFCCALVNRAGLENRLKKDILDLVAIGTIADIMPMIDENRTLVKYGLKAVRCSRRKGLCALLEGINVEKTRIREDDIAYSLVPHLNAAGRISDAGIAADILLSEDDREIARGVAELISRNETRKRIQNDTYRKCIQIVSDQIDIRKCLVIRCEDAHEGITGIVAGKIKDKYKKPVIILSPASDGLKGTGRSVPGIDLYNLLSGSERMFSKFGGHKGACGFTMDEEFFDEFFDEVEENINAIADGAKDASETENQADAQIDICDISSELIKEIELLAPFGQGNPEPVFLVTGRVRDIYYMGNEREHVRFMLVSGDGAYVRCVLFGNAQNYAGCLRTDRLISVTGNLKISEWRGNAFPQITVREIVQEVRL